MIIDAHTHLWKKQQGMIEGQPVYDVGGGKSMFAGQVVQMMPPYFRDGFNSASQLLANMDYAQVNAAVITQEYMDGNQDAYLSEVRQRYPDRFRICSLYEERADYAWEGFDGIKICAARLKRKTLSDLYELFERAQKDQKFISIDLAEGDTQTKELQALINAYPNVKIAIGHFGMANRQGWQEQIKLAQNRHVYIESGGITWLYHAQFYPYPGAIEAIKQAKEICGIDKIMWGSDYPRTMTAITYAMSYTFFSQSPQFSESEKAQFLWQNAASFYQFEKLTPLPPIKNMVEE